jgi:thymidylate synthase
MEQYSVKDIRNEFKSLLENDEFVIDKTGCKMVEIAGTSFIASEPTIFGTLNEDYAKREIEWYKSMSLNVNDIPGETPAVWKQVADANGMINSNYGWCVYSRENHYQFQNVLQELVRNRFSRRAIMIYTRPSIWAEFETVGMSDFICTNTVQYLIRNNKLHAFVQMRSNDAIFGYKNDLYWQQHVHTELHECLNESGVQCEIGDIIWNATSLHVYEKHFHLIK